MDRLCTIPTLRSLVRELVFERFGELCTPIILQQLKDTYAQELTDAEPIQQTPDETHTNDNIPKYSDLTNTEEIEL